MAPRVCSLSPILHASDGQLPQYLQFAPVITVEMTQQSDLPKSRSSHTGHVGAGCPSATFLVLNSSDCRYYGTVRHRNDETIRYNRIPFERREAIRKLSVVGYITHYICFEPRSRQFHATETYLCLIGIFVGGNAN
jgi:hypothetical protein